MKRKYIKKNPKKIKLKNCVGGFSDFSQNFDRSWGFLKYEHEKNFGWNVNFSFVSGRKLPEFHDEIKIKL
jgi:hypothetical protein